MRNMRILLVNYDSFQVIQNLNNEFTYYKNKNCSDKRYLKCIKLGKNNNKVYSPTSHLDNMKTWTFSLLERKHLGHGKCSLVL